MNDVILASNLLERERMYQHDARFPWDTLRSIVGGNSAIDVPHLHIGNLAGAEQFLDCYGFDWNRVAHREQLILLREQAIDFIDQELLDDNEEIPHTIREQDDPRQLLIWSSSEEDGPRRRWACALLRVAHTFAHSHSYFNDVYGDEIRRQILARFEPHLVMGIDGLTLGVEAGIELADFEVKTSKSIHSVVMKLLHKVENVAEDVFDRVGVRFVTRKRLDALLVVKFLRENNVFMFANVKPSRSRNTLIDLAWLEDFAAGLDRAVSSGELDESERLDTLREAVQSQDYPDAPQPGYNPYSAANYHSLQFTCRQMIRVLDHDGGREISFFFPFEVQVLDAESYERSRSGFASHELYKARQRDAVRRRVLGKLVEQRL